MQHLTQLPLKNMKQILLGALNNIHRLHGEGGGRFLVVLTPTTEVGTDLTFICKINFPFTLKEYM
jgi:hypothetical protein